MCFLGTLLLVQAASCSEASQAACESGAHSAVSVSLLVPSVPLKCSPNGLKTAEATFCGYNEGACDQECNSDVGSVLTSIGAKGKWADGALTIESFPPQEEKICFVCSQSRAAACTVVDIAKAAPSCTNKGVSGGVQARDLDLTLAEMETVYFSCPDTHQLSPEAASEAYDADCGEVAGPLPEGLVGEGNNTSKAYSLTLQKAPKTAVTVCYKCGTKKVLQTGTPENCRIKVTTQTTAQPPPPSDGDSPPASGAVIPTTSILLACVIAVATSRHVW